MHMSEGTFSHVAAQMTKRMNELSHTIYWKILISILGTLDSRYLEFQGTLLNASRYPYLEIKDLQNSGKKIFEQPHLTNIYIIGLLKLEIY